VAGAAGVPGRWRRGSPGPTPGDAFVRGDRCSALLPDGCGPGPGADGGDDRRTGSSAAARRMVVAGPVLGQSAGPTGSDVRPAVGMTGSAWGCDDCRLRLRRPMPPGAVAGPTDVSPGSPAITRGVDASAAALTESRSRRPPASSSSFREPASTTMLDAGLSVAGSPPRVRDGRAGLVRPDVASLIWRRGSSSFAIGSLGVTPAAIIRRSSSNRPPPVSAAVITRISGAPPGVAPPMTAAGRRDGAGRLVGVERRVRGTICSVQVRGRARSVARRAGGAVVRAPLAPDPELVAIPPPATRSDGSPDGSSSGAGRHQPTGGRSEVVSRFVASMIGRIEELRPIVRPKPTLDRPTVPTKRCDSIRRNRPVRGRTRSAMALPKRLATWSACVAEPIGSGVTGTESMMGDHEFFDGHVVR
jgi:hypothetical protein